MRSSGSWSGIARAPSGRVPVSDSVRSDPGGPRGGGVGHNHRMSVVIRAARPGDGAGLARAAVDFAAYYVELDPERFKQPVGDLVGWHEAELQRPVPGDAVWLVADSGGEAVGSVEATILEPREDAELQLVKDLGLRRAHVSYLAVQAAHRNQGIGTLLMAAVERWAREQGAELVLTDTRVGGLSVRFYEQNGYVQQSVILRKRLS